MTIPNKVNPSSSLKEFWKLVIKRVNVEFSSIHKAPAIFGEVSGIITILYILTILAISGDVYLAVKILMKAGVKPAFVFIQIGLDIFLAILPFLLLTFGVKFLDTVANKNWKLFYEMDTMLRRKDESDEDYKSRKRQNEETHLPRIERNLNWGRILTWITYFLIALVAFWKIKNYQATVPFNILNTANGKMVITLAILVAMFHIIATENTLIHLLYWIQKNSAIAKFNQSRNINEDPDLNDPVDILYVGNYTKAKSGYTEIIKEQDGSIKLKYAYIIRDEEINDLLTANADSNAKKGIIAACKNIQLQR